MFLSHQIDNNSLHINLANAWVVANSSQLEKQLLSLPKNIQHYFFDGSTITSIDITGAYLIWHHIIELKAQGKQVTLSHFTTNHFTLIESLGPLQIEATPRFAWLNPNTLLKALGKQAVNQYNTNIYTLDFFGQTVITFVSGLLHPRRLRIKSIAHHVYQTGILAIPIVCLIAFLISIVLAYQGATQLLQFGAEIYTIDLVAISVLREMGVLLTAIMVAGRSGSAFAAQIGVMKINQEIDAMYTMGLNPFELLVVPRIIALMIALPLLTLLANAMGLCGAALLSVIVLDVSLTQFLVRLEDAIELSTFWVGVVKAPVFAFIIAMVGTLRGMQVTGSAESAGSLTTVAVVQSIFMVILVDAIFSIIFSKLGI